MYARYAYVVGATPANILSDVCAILCGTTDKTLLSAACDKTLTEISFSRNPATWVLHDNAATATGKVLRQPCTDAICMKYLHLSSTGNGNFRHGISETWNATTHTGTNSGSGGTAFDVSLGNSSPMCDTTSYSPNSAPGYINIYSDPYLTAMSFKGNTTGYAAILTIEFTRAGPLMLAEYAYPNWAGGHNDLAYKRVRAKHLYTIGDTIGNSEANGVLVTQCLGAMSSNGSSTYKNSYRDKSEKVCFNIFCLKDMPLFTREDIGKGAFDYLGICLSDIKFSSSDSGGSGFDEAEVSGETYVKDFALNADTVNGYGCILYPKG